MDDSSKLRHTQLETRILHPEAHLQVKKTEKICWGFKGDLWAFRERRGRIGGRFGDSAKDGSRGLGRWTINVKDRCLESRYSSD